MTKIDNHYEKFVISGIIDKQKRSYYYLANRNKSNDGNKCKSSSVSSNKYYYLNATVNGTDLNEVAKKIEKKCFRKFKQSLSGTEIRCCCSNTTGCYQYAIQMVFLHRPFYPLNHSSYLYLALLISSIFLPLPFRIATDRNF